MKELGTNPKDLIGTTKVPIHTLPPAGIIYGALGMWDGAKKYSSYNWRGNKVIASIYIDAVMRHILSWFDGEDLAQDSQKPHLGHAIACLAILADAIETSNLVDDRPPKGVAAELLARYQLTRGNAGSEP